MAKFCKYCGKPLNDGVCDCPQAVAEAENQKRAEAQVLAAMQSTAAVEPAMEAAQAAAAAQTVGTAQAGPVNQSAQAAAQFEQAAQNAQEAARQAALAAQAGTQQLLQNAGLSDRLKVMKDLVFHFAKSPVSAMEQAVAAADKVPQYLAAAVFSIVMMVCMGILLNHDYFEGKVFNIAVTCVVVTLVIRAAYGAGVYLMAKKHNAAMTFDAVIGAFCLTFTLDTAVVVLFTICFALSFFELAIALLIFWAAGTVVTSLLATWALAGQQMEAAVKITLALQLILMVILVFAGRSFVVRTLGSAVGSLGLF